MYCEQWPIIGSKWCRTHVVDLAEARSRRNVVVELEKWQVSTQTTAIDPDETILRMLSQSVARADLYAAKLHEAYETGQRLQTLLRRQNDGDTLTDVEADELQQHRNRLEWIFETGGITALIGHTWAQTPKGQRFATGEEIRALARLEIEERKLAANFAKIASQRNIAERQIRLAEAQSAAVLSVVYGSLRALGLSPDDLQVREIVYQQLTAIGSGHDPVPIPGGL
jgi:hypothetical protein